jgi:hypothetical protein
VGSVWQEAVKKWTEKGDATGCVDGLDRAARLDPKVRQNGAFQNVYWRCVMGAGRCDEGAKYLRDKLAAEDTARRKTDAALDQEVVEEANRHCPSASAKSDAEYVIRAGREIHKAFQGSDEVTCRDRFDGIAQRYASLGSERRAQADARRSLELGWKCVAKVSGCAAAKALFSRAEKLERPKATDAEIDKKHARDCR